MRTTPSRLKKPFGTAKMVDITHVRYLDWEDAFDVEFEDGLSFLEHHAAIRRANRISAKAIPVGVVLDEETRTGFEVRYDTGEVAEVSWAFIRELPPQKSSEYGFREPGQLVAREAAPKYGRKKPDAGKP